MSVATVQALSIATVSWPSTVYCNCELCTVYCNCELAKTG